MCTGAVLRHGSFHLLLLAIIVLKYNEQHMCTSAFMPAGILWHEYIIIDLLTKEKVFRTALGARISMRRAYLICEPKLRLHT